ncbi:hypothetical protein BpHYR1_032868 [Brachionus plicatilis]|uniref:Uncharacterized protein n=1 Tax=Brachionus plicatilis TaxID=10195 RepID=A0A3M7QS10_BRAPC|nr:hypothetical protein BpHYR1_032868 [Brachionus plicatilis]
MSNDAPRALIREFQLSQSDNCIGNWPNKNAIRQQILRTRNVNAKGNPKCLEDVDIPEDLRLTYKNSKFFYGDSGKNDKNRIIFFTTEQNLKLLSSYHDWYCDGTLIFHQLCLNKFILFI